VHSGPLLGSGDELAVQAVLAEWRDATMYVASHIRPKKKKKKKKKSR
jgi:hypothetical protein